MFNMIAGTALGGAEILGNLWSDKKNREQARDINSQQYDLARNSIKYRVQDAKNSGIHPLYALGAPTMGSSVVSQPRSNPVAGLSQMGQDITRSLGSKSKYDAQLEELGMQDAIARNQNTVLQNELLQQELVNKKLANVHKAQTTARNPKDGLKMFGETAKYNPDFSDAEQAETRYGDIAQEIFGISNIIADIKHNYDSWSKSRKPYVPPKKRSYR